MAGPTPSVSNICPFLSTTYLLVGDPSTEEAVWTTCIGSNCRLWDTTENECSIKLLIGLLPIVTLQNHLHDSHDHIKPHEANNDNPGDGAPLTKPTLIASELVKESAGNEDCDGNGYIYAKDFMITQDDSDMPEMVSGVVVPDDYIGSFISWADYLNSTSVYSINVGG
jgi:hypothetical protein